MSVQSIPIDESPLMIFQGPGFFMRMPTNWLIVSEDDGRIAFIGPKVGAAHAGFTTKVAPSVGADGAVVDHASAAKSAITEQKKSRENFTILSEEDLSTESMHAYMIYCHWYNPEIDMILVQRQLYTVYNNLLYTLTSSVPNSDHISEFDRLFMGMFGSFRYGNLDIDSTKR